MVEALVQPTRSGRLEIPAYTLEYFDPQSKTYKRSRTKPMSIMVSRAKTPAGGAAGSGVSRKEIASGARPVHLGVTSASSPLGAWPAVLGSLLGLFSWMSLAWIGRKREDAAGNNSVQRSKRGKQRSRAMQAAHAEKDLGRARALVMDALADRAGDHIRALPQGELVAGCVEAGVDVERARALVAFFDAVDAVRFTPNASQSRQQLFEEGARLQSALDGDVG